MAGVSEGGDGATAGVPPGRAVAEPAGTAVAVEETIGAGVGVVGVGGLPPEQADDTVSSTASGTVRRRDSLKR